MSVFAWVMFLTYSLCCVVVQFHVSGRDYFACGIVVARRTNVVWALKLTTVVTFVWVRCNK